MRQGACVHLGTRVRIRARACRRVCLCASAPRACTGITRTAAPVSRTIEVYWPADRIWYCCEVFDYVPADGTHLLEYIWDGEQEYLDLEANDWRLASEATVKAQRGEAAGHTEKKRVAVKAARAGQSGGSDTAGVDEDENDGETEAGQGRAHRAETGEGSQAAAAVTTDLEVGEAGDGKGDGRPAAAPERDWRAEGPRVEAAMTLNAIKAALPLSSKSPAEYAPPEGWTEHVAKVPAKWRVQAKWIRAESTEGGPTVVDGREDLEMLLEKEERTGRGRPWLGQLVESQWEIRKHSVDDAIESVLSDLIGAGLVRMVSGEAAGKGSAPLYCVANRYVKGAPFPVVRNYKKKAAEEEEEELCDFELERKRNIERNKELLRQLGLA